MKISRDENVYLKAIKNISKDKNIRDVYKRLREKSPKEVYRRIYDKAVN